MFRSLTYHVFHEKGNPAMHHVGIHRALSLKELAQSQLMKSYTIWMECAPAGTQLSNFEKILGYYIVLFVYRRRHQAWTQPQPLL